MNSREILSRIFDTTVEELLANEREEKMEYVGEYFTNIPIRRGFLRPLVTEEGFVITFVDPEKACSCRLLDHNKKLDIFTFNQAEEALLYKKDN